MGTTSFWTLPPPLNDCSLLLATQTFYECVRLWLLKGKVKVMLICISPIHETSLKVYSTHCQGITQFYLHTLRFICKQNKPYLPLPSKLQLVLIY